MDPSNLRFAAPLLDSERWSSSAVARWMVRNVPCFEGGKVPYEWTGAVIKSLSDQMVQAPVIGQALKLARIHGHDFGDIELNQAGPMVLWGYKQPPLPPGHVAPDSMGQAEPMTEAEAIRVAAIFEEQYVLAVRTNDYRGQARILNSFKNLSRRVVAAIMMGRRPKQAEDLNKAKEQVQTRAPTVSSDADRLERAGVQNPTEHDVRNRLVPMRRPSQGSRTRK
jgi:hypothetical protein